MNKSSKLLQQLSIQQEFRLNLLMVFVIFLSCILVLRLAYLQIVQFYHYRTLSLKNQISITPVVPPRGIICDRNGVVLAENVPVYSLEIIPERIENINNTIQNLQKLLPGITQDDIKNFVRLRKQNRAFVSLPLKLKLSHEEVAIFASNQYKFPGVNIRARLMRFYPFGEVIAHALGYMGRINAQELNEINRINYQSTNFIGKAGVEKYYETLLHGKVGYQQVETNASGRILRVINKHNPIPGEHLYLTLDIHLQQAAYAALGNKRGAIVAINPKNGDILAMVSKPSFDPNHFVNGITEEEYNNLINASEQPLYNRAVRGLYPPASTIKPFIALAGLEKGIVDVQYKIYDPGWFRLPGVSHAYHDWKKNGHGIINLKRAIIVSCDTYFYHLGYKMGIMSLENMLRKFGFGELTQIDLKEEANGLIPNKYWKMQSKGVAWYPGDTIITSIGQGFMLVTPLQLANATAALSQNGKRFRPHLLLKSLHNETGKVTLFQPLEEYPISLKNNKYWEIITDAMEGVITNKEGTGYRVGRNLNYTIAAKTGTAQLFSNEQYEKKRNQELPEYLRDNSTFIAFSPVKNPEIVIAVVEENDFAAANIARSVLDTFYKLKNTEQTHATISDTANL